MLRYVAGRLIQAIIAVFGVLTIVFIVMRFSGDPTLLLVPEGASQESIDALRTALGFDRPVIVQYIDYMRSLSHLDFGVSVVQRIPALDIVAPRIPYTMLLASGALIIAVGVGIPVGIAMAVWRGGWLERSLAAVVLTGQSMPTFLSSILLILIFGVMLGWLPTSGAGDLQALVLPSMCARRLVNVDLRPHGPNLDRRRAWQRLR
jgi:peptide/nickel transport system permease protein